MAKKTEKISIGTTQFTITQLGAIEGRKLYKKLITALGPVLRDAFSGSKAKDGAEERVFGLIVRAIEELPLPLMEELCDSFSAACLFQTPTMTVAIPLSTMGQFDDLFAGDYGVMTNWLMSCIKINFANFLGVLPTSPSPAVASASSQ